MKLVVGFGNPEAKYNFTRHNTGFLALDFYAKVKGLNWENSSKFNAVWLKVNIANLLQDSGKSNSEQVIFIKPETYYNNVGESIAAFANFYKIPASDILVVCDDFNLDFGKTRFREKGSAGGNNGLKSTIATLGTENFPRLRIGTDSASRIGSNLATAALKRASSGEKIDTSNVGKISDIDFVLSKFTPEEKERLPELLRSVVSEIDSWLES